MDLWLSCAIRVAAKWGCTKGATSTGRAPTPFDFGCRRPITLRDQTHGFVPDVADYQVADFLHNLTEKYDVTPWKTLPLRQIYTDGNRQSLKAWLVNADTPPGRGTYFSGDVAVHIQPKCGQYCLCLAQWWGMPPGISRMLGTFYDQFTSVFKFNGRFGNRGRELTRLRMDVHST